MSTRNLLSFSRKEPTNKKLLIMASQRTTQKDELTDDLHTGLQEKVIRFMKKGGNDGNTKNLPAIIAILRL